MSSPQDHHADKAQLDDGFIKDRVARCSYTRQLGDLVSDVPAFKRGAAQNAKRLKKKKNKVAAVSKLSVTDRDWFETPTEIRDNCFIFQGDFEFPVAGVRSINAESLRSLQDVKCESSECGTDVLGFKDKETGELIARVVPERQLADIKWVRTAMDKFLPQIFDAKTDPTMAEIDPSSAFGAIYRQVHPDDNWKPHAIMVGHRHSYDREGIDRYKCKHSVHKNEAERLEKIARDVVDACELWSNRSLDKTEDTLAKAAMKEFELPVIGKASTQVHVRRNFFSPVHTCEDVYFCTVGVRRSPQMPTSEMPEQGTPLHYVCFPRYGIKIPLASGEVLLFNPQTPHCVTQSLHKDTYIYSSSVSEKTIASIGTAEFKRKLAEWSTTLEEPAKKRHRST